MPSKVILIAIEFMFLGIIIYVLGPSQTHFSPRLGAQAKMSLSRAQNIFLPKNINSIVTLLFLSMRGDGINSKVSFTRLIIKNTTVSVYI